MILHLRATNDEVPATTIESLPPRVLIVMPEQWPRAHLRAALREVGYDAIGTRTLSGALAYPAQARGRGPVRALVLDSGAFLAGPAGCPGGAEQLEALTRKQGPLPVVLLASAVRSDPPGQWTRVVRRPFSIEDAVRAVEAVTPLPAERRTPVDAPGA